MRRFYILFVCHYSIPVCHQRLSRLIHGLIFSCLAGSQFADYITCLTAQRIWLRFLHTTTFSSFCTCLSFTMFQLFAIFPSQCALIGSVEQPTSTIFSRLAGGQLLFAQPVSPHAHAVCFGFHRLLHFCQFIFEFAHI